MQLNQELINKLAKGEIQLHNTGTVEQLREILKIAAPFDNSMPSGISEFYKITSSGNWLDSGFDPFPNLPIYTTEQFFQVPDTAKQEQVVWQCSPNENPYGSDKAQSVIDDTLLNKTMDKETRELAKRLFEGKMYAGHLPTGHAMKQAIQNAKDFIQLLNEQS